MPIEYLNGRSWSEWSRDERMYCAVLWEKAKKDPGDFARWLAVAAKIEVDTTGDWDLGYEVVFYRDFLFQKGFKVSETEYSNKRTFDLCLFGEREVFIIEAKAWSGFEFDQNESFQTDIDNVEALLGSDISVRLVGLACSRYWKNVDKYGNKETTSLFEGRIDWGQVAEKYNDSALVEAESLYKLEPKFT